ncbi:MAG TPA: hypothetical protein VFG45_09650 [Candidatus Nitrosocosmicus sp.]|jgi:hypothetical protein|uniref:hypothetical protein n=1 Tax=Candidatus Nitrosocosmicus agrestis TaxID=2563600 RepID=UPI001E4457A9|nr:hypothetical protein [Candidatus Nitrosocosmicus sp. SS]MDR4491714.1 hypothetical protein [Candidatus Nitrosocosmicus sp.]HET6590416.1 hypothetical protein [Candidatus Nitrosocosmicus sp.]
MAIEKSYINEKVSRKVSEQSDENVEVINHNKNGANTVDVRTPVDEEEAFRIRYSQELKNKKQQIYDNDRGYNELDDERRRVRQQMMRTPGRRGEIIKDEEINKEFARRFSEGQTSPKE